MRWEIVIRGEGSDAEMGALTERSRDFVGSLKLLSAGGTIELNAATLTANGKIVHLEDEAQS